MADLGGSLSRGFAAGAGAARSNLPQMIAQLMQTGMQQEVQREQIATGQGARYAQPPAGMKQQAAVGTEQAQKIIEQMPPGSQFKAKTPEGEMTLKTPQEMGDDEMFVALTKVVAASPFTSAKGGNVVQQAMKAFLAYKEFGAAGAEAILEGRSIEELRLQREEEKETKKTQAASAEPTGVQQPVQQPAQPQAQPKFQAPTAPAAVQPRELTYEELVAKMLSDGRARTREEAMQMLSRMGIKKGV